MHSRPAALALLRVGAAMAAMPFAATASPAGDDPAPEPAPVHAPAECEVWARELSFARSVAEHDAAAFAEHIHAAAAFAASKPTPMRGRDPIARGWAKIVAGEGVRLHWYPTRVTIAGEGDIAWSSGPSLYEQLDGPDGPRVALGGFHSVWHRGGDGTWRVLFDDGIPSRPATAADIEAFHAGRREACPAG